MSNRPISGKTTWHRDGTVTYWDVYEQGWRRVSTAQRDHSDDRLWSSLGASERHRLHWCDEDPVICPVPDDLTGVADEVED